MFEVYNIHTGRRAVMQIGDTREYCQYLIDHARRNVERGLRPDLADKIDSWDIRPVPLDNVRSI